MTKLLKDKMYKKAITTQVQKIAFEPGAGGYTHWKFEEGTLIGSHTLSVNFKDVATCGSLYIEETARNLTQTIDSELT